MPTGNIIELKRNLVSAAIQLGFLKIEGSGLVLTKAGRLKVASIPDLLKRIRSGQIKTPKHVQVHPQLNETHLRKVDVRLR